MIHILDKKIADKIAAGEVVERPVSIMKELVENAIDARATHIVCEIKKGGKEYIRVSDDGVGIEKDDVERAFLRHGTSKIFQAEDLDYIETLGFRGEALASIAAVSQTRLITKVEGEPLGTKIVVEAGEILEKQSIGCEKGTNVIVENLFFNTPARKKFLKKDSSESRQIIDFLTRMALAYPHIALRFISNGNVLFHSKGNGRRDQIIQSLLGKDLGDKLLCFDAEGEDLRLEGYISGPGESRSNKRGQVYFVNGRTVDSKIMEKAVANAYKDQLFEGRYPLCYLFLEINPALVDVNVHPHKKEIRFMEGQRVQDFLEGAIKKQIASKKAIPEIDLRDNPLVDSEKILAASRQGEQGLSSDGGKREKIAPAGEKQVDVEALLSSLRKQEEESSSIREDSVESGLSSQVKESHRDIPSSESVDPFPRLKVEGSVFGTYIFATDSQNLYFIDQHAAHERIYFEQLRRNFFHQTPRIQHILTPILVEVEMTEHEWIKALEQMGFILKEFGPTTYAVEGIPMIFSLEQARDFVGEYVENINEETDFQSETVLDRLASAACKKAVKGNTALNPEEMTTLLENLKQCENPYSCPHGRPTFTKISQYELERRFKRT